MTPAEQKFHRMLCEDEQDLKPPVLRLVYDVDNGGIQK